MPALNYATQYAQALSQAYPNVLHFGALFARRQEGDYKWVNGNTIQVPSLSVTGRTDGDRDSIGTKTRRHNNSWTPLTLRNHRKWDDLIHPSDISETNQAVSIQNITKTFNETEKFPEMDKYLISTLFSDWCAKARVNFAVALTTANILTYFDYMMEMMTEKNVPAAGRILYITPPVDTLIKNATAISRTLDVKDMSASIVRALSYIDMVTIEVVPSDHMQTVYDFTVGAVKGATAKQIQMFLVHPSAVITPINYTFAQLDPPAAGSDGKWVYFEESEEDVFVLPNKEYGIEFLTASINLGTATFTSAASAEAGAVVGDCAVTITAPTGASLLSGSRYFFKAKTGSAEAAPAYGEDLIKTGGWTEWDGTEVISITNGYYLTLVVADKDGRAYASGNATVTSKTA